jgi:hypothetical protein
MIISENTNGGERHPIVILQAWPVWTAMRLNYFPGFLWEPSLHQTFRAMNNDNYVFWQKQQSYASPLISARTEFLNPAWPGTPRTPLWIILPPSLSTSSSPMTRSEPPRCALVNVQSLAISMCWKHSPTTEKKKKTEKHCPMSCSSRLGYA